MTSEATIKKDVQKLQRAIVDGLEDVKAHNIEVFNTEHLSPLFERVIVASGTSNRQTKALAASVRDAVKEAGFAKPRIEGEDNGEWIIVDCGMAVAHIMQPAIRQYYHLEEIWGEKPIKLKRGAAAPAVEPPAAKRAAAAGKKVAQAAPRKTAAVKTAARKTTARTAAKSAADKPARKAVAKTVAKPAAKRAPAVKRAPTAKKSGTARPAAKKATRKTARKA